MSVEPNGTFDDKRFHDVSPRGISQLILGEHDMGEHGLLYPRHEFCRKIN